MLALAALLLLQEDAQTAGVPEPVLRPAPLEALVPDSPLGALEEELYRLHTLLRPSLVKVRMPVRVEVEGGEPRVQEVLVSGVVIDEGGLLVAPGLVLEGSRQVLVVRFDGKEFEARSVARDKSYGLSLFRADGLDVPPPPLGHCEMARIGTITVTLGNAFGLDGTLGIGFVAGVDRKLGHAEGLLQLTNTVNPGDGGGIVANRHGQVIGVLLTSLREAARHQYELTGREDRQGMLRSEAVSFAIPIDAILRNFAEHLKRSVPERPHIGVVVNEQLQPEVCRKLGLEGDLALVVIEVNEGSPAAKAGVLPGDVLLDFAGAEIRTIACLRHALVMSRHSQVNRLAVWRDDRRLDLKLRFSE